MIFIKPLTRALSRAGFMLQVEGGKLSERDAPRVGDDQHSAALLDRLPDAHPDHRMLFGGIRADDEICPGFVGYIFN